MPSDRLPTATAQWTYLGPRPGVSRARVHVWRAADGALKTFIPADGSVVGGVYNVEATLDQTGYYGSPEWTGQMAPDAADLQLQAAEYRSALERKAAERRAAKPDPTLSRILDSVTAYVHDQNLSYEGRAALANALHRACWANGRAK